MRFAHAVIALAGAGTVTLELAMMDVPMVGTYVPDWLQMRAYRRWGKPLIGLPNIILGKRLVPEIEPGTDHAARVLSEAMRLLDDDDARAGQRAGFAELRRQIIEGLPDIGRQNAAERYSSRNFAKPRAAKRKSRRLVGAGFECFADAEISGREYPNNRGSRRRHRAGADGRSFSADRRSFPSTEQSSRQSATWRRWR